MSLIVLCGPSGVGKSTMLKAILPDFPKIKFAVSYTTRAPREGEVDGKDYHFVTVEEFKRGLQDDAFLEWAEVFGNYYGTSAQEVQANGERGYATLLDIDPQGVRQVWAKRPDAYYLAVMPPADVAQLGSAQPHSFQRTLEARLRTRGTDSEETIQRRLKGFAAYEKIVLEGGVFHHIVVNDDLATATQELHARLESRMSFEEIRDQLGELNEDAILFDGFEDALIGYIQRFSASGHVLVALYDRAKCIEILMDRDGMDEEGAEEFFGFNVEGCYAGEHTPAFATLFPG